jgi:hypothetical protein
LYAAMPPPTPRTKAGDGIKHPHPAKRRVAPRFH